jgi:hypothetical protein
MAGVGIGAGRQKEPQFRSVIHDVTTLVVYPSLDSSTVRLNLSPSIRILACAGVDGVDALLSTTHRQFHTRARDMA